MAEILGAGVTHYPPLIAPDEDRAYPLLRTLKNDERLPEKLKDPMNWPEDMRQEFGTTKVWRRLSGTENGWWPVSGRLGRR